MTNLCMQIPVTSELREFFEAEAAHIEFVADIADAETTAMPGRHKESDLSTIYAGGWIACETARELARRLGISLRQMGKLLDHLNVKVRQCGLGCFR